MAALPEPIKDLRSKFESIVERVRRLENAASNKLSGTGLSVPGPGVVQVDGDLRVVDGAVLSDSFNGTDFAHPGTSGNYFGDDGLVLNNAYFRPGSVGNDALTNPVIPQSVWKGTTADFGLNTGWATLTAQTQNAPAGATSVIVHGFVRLVATNTTASKDYLYSDLDIAGQSCGGFATPVAAGDVGTSFCSFARVLTGVSSVTLTAYGSTSTGTWATGTGNVCQISASVLWFR